MPQITQINLTGGNFTGNMTNHTPDNMTDKQFLELLASELIYPAANPAPRIPYGARGELATFRRDAITSITVTRG